MTNAAWQDDRSELHHEAPAMRGLAGRRVLISGGSSGIGLATARRFLDEGSRVFIAGLDAVEVAAARDPAAGR
jgi:NAD(P)-dependent dehydrogenase (short-subunit alcohol dehydrogenase family)